jgi:hypothetical protein
MQLNITKLRFVMAKFPSLLSCIRSRNISGSNMTGYGVLFLAWVLIFSDLDLENLDILVEGYQPALWRNLPRLSGLKVEATDSLETFVAT